MVLLLGLVRAAAAVIWRRPNRDLESRFPPSLEHARDGCQTEHGARAHMRAPRLVSGCLAERPERRPELGAEKRRLFPRGEVTAAIYLVEVD